MCNLCDSLTSNSGILVRENILCPDDVIAGKLYTKDTRKKQFGNVAGHGGSMNPEKYQVEKIEEGTFHECFKTNVRINRRTHVLEDIVQPNTREEGFDYTENFDGCQKILTNTLYINLKSVVGKGGSQTKTLRETVYGFIEAQLLVLLKIDTNNVLFVNILDGDQAHVAMKHYKYLLNRPEYTTVKHRCYVGDLRDYFEWVKKMM